MKIAVCIKQVPDTDNVKIDRKTGTLIRSEVPGILNPADSHALLAAAGFAEEVRKSGEAVTIICITMGPPQARAALREGMAYGADEGILLCDPDFAGADTFATSLVLAAAIEKAGEISLVFTGNQSTDGETGHIGPQLAEHLGMAQVTFARWVRWETNLIACQIMDGMQKHLRVELPAVISAGKRGRAPEDLSIGAICAAYDKPVTVWGLADLPLHKAAVGLSGSLTEVRRTYLPKESPKGEMLSGNQEELVKVVMEKLKDRHILS